MYLNKIKEKINRNETDIFEINNTLYTWFKDTSLSQLARGIYYFARNRFEHAKWLRGGMRSIPNNYLGRISWESRPGRDPKKRKFRSRNSRWLVFPLSLRFSSRPVFRYEHSFVGNVGQLRRFTTDSDSSTGRISKIDTRHCPLFVLYRVFAQLLTRKCST